MPPKMTKTRDRRRHRPTEPRARIPCISTSSLTLALTIASLSSAVHAGSVTLYGIVDSGLDYVSNEGGRHNTKLVGGVMSSNRWGLRGTEDLGGGLKAVFTLENGFDLSSGKTGQNGREFGRQSWVGLSNPQYGTLTLGRQWDIFGDFLWEGNASNTFGSWMATHPGDIDNLDSTYKSNNAVKYISTDWKGWAVGGTYAFGNQVGGLARDSIWSAALRYRHGPLKVAAGYIDFNRPNPASWDGTPQTVGTFAVAAPVAGGYASAAHQRIAAVSGTFDIADQLTAGGSFSHTRFSGLGSDAGPNPHGYRDDVLFYSGEANLLYRLRPDTSIGTFYHFTWSRPHDGQGGARYHQGGAVFDYSLSKATDVYVLAQYQHASGTDSTGTRAVAQIDGLSASSGASQWVARVGIRHRF